MQGWVDAIISDIGAGVFRGDAWTIVYEYEKYLAQNIREQHGVFYTPQYIVEYIVKNTVGKLIEGKTPDDIAKIKICDPACGSGSFLLGAYQYLLDYHTNWFNKNYKKSKNAKASPLTPEGKLVTHIKKEILLNNIFGVDIDAQAVEVTKLSLLMKCMEGETQASLQTEMVLQRVLPTLDNNIKSGNSLVDFDFYDGQFDFEPQIEKKVKPFNWKQAFPEVFKPRERIAENLQEKLIRHNEWVKQQSLEMQRRANDLLNGVEENQMAYNKAITLSGGFDIVIGNPPYVYLPDKNLQKYFAAKYLYQDYQQDLYLLFMERYEHILAENGYLGVIISNTWLQSVLLKKIRRYLVQNYCWHKFLHLPDRVFQDAVVDTHVLIFEKDKPLFSDTVKIEVYKNAEIWASHELVQSELPQTGEPINLIAKPAEKVLFEKIKNNSNTIRDFCFSNVGVKPFQVGKGKPKQTREIVDKKPFVVEKSSKPQGDYWLPLMRGSLMNRYTNFWNNNSWIQYGEWLAEPRDPKIFEASEKIIVRQTGDSIIATIIGKNIICRNNLHILLSDTLNHRFILGILNSKLTNFFYQQINPEKGEALAEVKKIHVEQLPLPKEYSQSTHDEIVKNVELLLKLNADLQTETNPQKKAQIQGRIVYAEQRIDEIVYELYGLSGEEIQIIESQ